MKGGKLDSVLKYAFHKQCIGHYAHLNRVFFKDVLIISILFCNLVVHPLLEGQRFEPVTPIAQN
jgi:hypothetical protein